MPEHLILLEGGPQHGREIRGHYKAPGVLVFPCCGPPNPLPPTVPRRPRWWRNPAAWYHWQPPPPWTPPEPQFLQFTYRDSGETRGSYRVYKADEPWEWYSGPEVHPYALGDDLYRELCAALYSVPPHVRADGGTRWVMTLEWHKRLRRELPWISEADDDSEDKSGWVAEPDDIILGKPLEIREDGGAPHIESPRVPAA